MRNAKFWQIAVVVLCAGVLYVRHGLRSDRLPSIVNTAHAGEVVSAATGLVSLYTTNADGTRLHLWRTDEFGKPRYVGTASVDGSFYEPARSAKALLGTWKADVSVGVLGAMIGAESSVELTLAPDGRYVLTSTHRDKQSAPVKETTTGTYQLQGENLVLTDSKGKTTQGIVAMNGDRRFLLRFANADPTAKALGFDSLAFSKQ